MTTSKDFGRFAFAAVVTSIVAFAYFAGIGAIVGREHDRDVIIGRALASIVVGTLFSLRTQRANDTPSDAAREGFLLAVVVVVSNSLLGSEALGRELAIRTAAVLLGLPALAVVSHALIQKRPGLAPEE